MNLHVISKISTLVLKNVLIFFSLAFLTGSVYGDTGSTYVIDLRCEYFDEPLGIDTPEPRFSWIIKSPKRGFMQSAFEIQVSKQNNFSNSHELFVWNSGKVHSQKSINITYKGKALKSGTTYYWRVRVWDDEGHTSPWSKVASFHMGLLEQSDWKANWIASTDTKDRSPLLRKEFTLKKVKKAFVYVSGIGNYELYLNGKRVGDFVMEPGPSQHERRVLYMTHDVTNYLKSGNNAIGLWLGEGWGAYSVSDSSRFYQKAKAIGPFDRPTAILQLDVILSSGEVQRIITDETWKTSSSPLTYNNFFGGEDYDARLEQPGWNTPHFEKKWEPVLIKKVKAQLSAQLCPPMKVMDVLKPIKKTHPQKNIFVYDFGHVFGGWFRVAVQGESGVRLKIRGSETLGNSKFPQPLNKNLTLNFSRKCFRECQSQYILRGDGIEVYEPKFYYNGFRYLQIETDHPNALDFLSVKGCIIHSSIEQTGYFECSTKILNDIHRMSVGTFKTIFQGLPGGNTNDEKYAWTGDAHLFFGAAVQNFDMAAFWTKWLTDVADAQSMFKSGVVPNVAPHYHKIVKEKPLRATTAAWGAAYPIVAWATYQYFDDERILADHYKGIKRYCDYLTSISRNYLIKGKIGDHNAPGISPQGEYIDQGKPLWTANLAESAYYFRCIHIQSQIAGVLGKKAESLRYAELAEKIKSAFNDKYFDPERKIYRGGTPAPGFFPLQAINLIPLQMGLVPIEYRQTVLNHVINDISKTHNYHLFTGILGSKAMVDVLPKYKYSDVLYKVATQKSFPGWGYMLENGATTLWQHWTGHKGDHAHAMWGVIDEFFLQDLAGIKSPLNDETAIGYKNIVIRPSAVKNMISANASAKSVRGRIVSDWKRDENRFTLKVQIPANSSATICVPRFHFSDYQIKENDKIIWEQEKFIPGTEGIYHGKLNGDYIEFSVGSGRYQFQYEPDI
ncbi:MAG: family 78 glycoside hydrolase catalytic domain [candidate division KSB1 bacterium]|nr:family 78 glycoside hydrolase catalytic domain [candidate division KSB1 bacterium]